jgi:sec-independent protein translocase protein TatA
MFRNPFTDAIVAVVVLLLVFGPKRLPQLGRSLGAGIREFKDSITRQSAREEAEPVALIPAETSASASSQAAPPFQAPSQQ